MVVSQSDAGVKVTHFPEVCVFQCSLSSPPHSLIHSPRNLDLHGTQIVGDA